MMRPHISELGMGLLIRNLVHGAPLRSQVPPFTGHDRLNTHSHLRFLVSRPNASVKLLKFYQRNHFINQASQTDMGMPR
jgi:hypothetical protein